jgi:hypothetical protein
MTTTKQAYEWVKTGHWSLREFTEWFNSQQLRKPLTDEEIEDVANECENSKKPWCDIVFARAIEAKHGIGDK